MLRLFAPQFLCQVWACRNLHSKSAFDKLELTRNWLRLTIIFTRIMYKTNQRHSTYRRGRSWPCGFMEVVSKVFWYGRGAVQWRGRGPLMTIYTKHQIIKQARPWFWICMAAVRWKWFLLCRSRQHMQQPVWVARLGNFITQVKSPDVKKAYEWFKGMVLM